MRRLEDDNGNPIALGDTIVHVSRSSSSINMKYGLITGIDIVRGDRYKLTVLFYARYYDFKLRGYSYKVYQRVLTANNFLKADVPADVRVKLFNAVKI